MATDWVRQFDLSGGIMITIGAGMGGLTLARILHVHGIAAQIYEADPSPTARHQGGMLDIHEDTGQAALRRAGLFDHFHAITLEEGDALRILDKSGTVRISNDGNGARPEVERGALRDLVLSSLPDGMVQWGARVSKLARIGGSYELTFADGSSVTTNVLIGADGARSKVREVLSDARPVYSGVSFVENRFFDADKRHPIAAALVGKGIMFALSDEKGIIAHREPDSELCIYIALKAPADWSRTEINREAMAAYFADWSDDLRTLITGGEGDLAPRPIYALPVGHRWDRLPGVTLVGDAAHLMSPFAGEGVNLAMIDGADLAMAIVEHPDDIEAAFASYEAVMFPRAEVAAAESAKNVDIAFQPNPQGFLDLFGGYLPRA